MEAAPEGYRLGKQIYASPRSTICEAVRESDGAEVLLKSYLADRAADPTSRAPREFELLRRAAASGIPRAFELARSTERPWLVLERLPGTSLAHLVQAGPLDLDTWLHVATQAAETLARVHAARVLHKDLSPSNVLFDRASGRVSICDFGMSRELGAAELGGRPASGTMGGTLPYIAPEQTGRMNRGCDFRSDLYTLGATLYHVLTGRPPFESLDPLELIHAHIARVPQSPSELRPEIPQTLSRMLLQLLRKAPEERYQSARALHADLLACREQRTSTGSIAPDFALGSAEVPDRPRFTAKLHGRESEVALVSQTYTEASQGRTRTLYSIRGEPGAGKSALVEQLRPLLARTGGYLATGKFDLYRDRPHAGWIGALGSLIHQLLVESDASLQRWRESLRAVLGNIAQALVDVVPDLKFILGEVPAVPELGSRETQARLSLALQRFIAVAATPEHPLVIFLDDLQWSDAASRLLLEELLAGPPAALLLIGAYRASDVTAAHPLPALIARVGQRTASARVELGTLSRDAVERMLAEALERSPEDARSLAALVDRRTGSLPLLVQQFVEHVHQRGLLRYESGAGWTWDAAQISAVDLPDGAVALMMGRIDCLEPEPRAVLQFASCVSDEFDVDLLCALDRRERSALERALYALADAGLLAPCPSGFRFVHDRIREAAQRQLSEQERARIHYHTAQLLLERTPEQEWPQRAFEIVEHLNRGIQHVPEELRITVIRLNQLAGQRALASGAAATASAYFEIARRLLGEMEGEVPAPLVLEVSLQSAEGLYQAGEFERALELLDAIDASALDPGGFLRVESKRIQIFAVCREATACVQYTLGILRRLGVRWPLHPSRLHAQLALWLVWRRLRRSKHPDLLEPARTVSLAWIAPLLLIRPSAAALSRVDVHLAVLATCLSMRRQIRHGHSVGVGFSIAVYATYQYLFLGGAERAQRLARIALDLAERSTPEQAPRCRHMVHAVLYPFLMRRRQAIASLDRIREAAREVGDREFAYYSHFTQTLYLALAGDPVPEITKRLDELGEEVRSAELWYPQVARCASVYGLLAQEPPSSVVMEERFREDMARPYLPGASFYADALWLIVLIVFGRPDLAFERSERAAPTLFRVSPFVQVFDYVFYRGLAAAMLAGPARGRARRRCRKALRQSLRHLERRAVDGPDFVHMASLLQAERARLAGHLSRARLLYTQAAQQAKQQSFPHHAALAHERRASLLQGARRHAEAAGALREASALYREWGALGKAELLTRESQGGGDRR